MHTRVVIEEAAEEAAEVAIHELEKQGIHEEDEVLEFVNSFRKKVLRRTAANDGRPPVSELPEA